MFFHELAMTNVGPFAGTTTIDFGVMAATGLFLLEGPTGAGKSTVLDSLVFALYGQVGGTHSSASRMRSDFALANEPSEVSLVFETTAGVFRIRRSPAYERAKKSGVGTTSQNATVRLWRLANPTAADGELLSNRSGEVDDEIYRIIGLTRTQFVQTVLLPQGEFANFLRAAPEQRRELLQKIFGTQLYENMTAALETQRREAHATRGRVQEQFQQALTAFLTAVAASAEQQDVLRASDVNDVLPLATSLLEDLTQQNQEASGAADQAHEHLGAALRGLASARRTLELKERRDLLLERSRTLEEARPVYEATAVQLRLLESVTSVASIYEALSEAAKAHEELQGKAQSQHLEYLELFDEPLVDTEGRARTLRDEIQSLVPALRYEAALEPLTQNLANLTEAQQRQSTDLAEVTEKAAALPGELRALAEEHAEVTALAAQLPRLEEAHQHSLDRHTAAVSAQEYRGKVAKAKERLRVAHTAASTASAEHERLRQARIAGMAAELAVELVDGQECLVCGATQHPKPNQEDVLVPSEQLSQAEANVAARMMDLATRQTELREVELSLAAFTATAEGLEPEQSQAKAQTARNELDAAHAAQQHEHSVVKKREALEAELSALTAKTEALNMSIGKRASDLASLQTEAARQIEEVRKARGCFTSVGERNQALVDQSEFLDRLTAVDRQLEEAKRALDRANRTWSRSLETIDLVDTTSFEQFYAQRGRVPDLRSQLEQYQSEFANVQAGLTELDRLESSESSNVVAGPVLDSVISQETVDEREHEVERLEILRDTARTRASQLVSRLADSADRLSQLDSAIEHSKKTHAETEEIIRLAEIANATSPENLHKVPLATYVLMSRFRDVVTAANLRLQAMSDGKYSLIHKQERESRGRKSGLGLSVRDHQAECDRQPGDLSGGETFYTALALALGLADVVVAEAGGVELNTLFIDEGFGSLDAVTLDTVLSEITKLQREGRTIGVVSHVDELKARIPERIEVRRAANGRSTIRVVA